MNELILLDTREAAQMMRISVSGLLFRIEKGTFPKPFTRPGQKRMWVKEHVEQWIREQSIQRDEQVKDAEIAITSRSARKARIKAAAETLKKHGIDWNPEL